MNKLPQKQRRLIIKMAIVVLWIGLGVLLFVQNRGHSLLIDNRDIDGTRASDLIKVTVDKEKSLEFFRGDRDIIFVGGGRHRLRVEYTDGKPPFETNFTLPLGPDTFLLSIPRITSGAENAIEEFNRQAEQRNNAEDRKIDFQEN